MQFLRCILSATRVAGTAEAEHFLKGAGHGASAPKDSGRVLVGGVPRGRACRVLCQFLEHPKSTPPGWENRDRVRSGGHVRVLEDEQHQHPPPLEMDHGRCSCQGGASGS